MCNNVERVVKKKSNAASIVFRGTKIYSKLTCANKVVLIAETIMLDNWCGKNFYKSLKTSSSTWLVMYDLDSEKRKQSKTLYELPQFVRVRQVKIADGFMYCSCNFRNGFGIDYPRAYHVVSQSK